MKEQSIILPIEGADFRKRRLGTLGLFFLNLAVDKGWEVVIKPLRLTRSNAQNRALWGHAYKILEEETGNDPEDLHEYFLGEHTGWEVRNIFGQKKRVPKKRSSKMDTAEFAKFFTFIQQRVASTAGIYIPDPNPNWWAEKERGEIPWLEQRAA